MGQPQGLFVAVGGNPQVKKQLTKRNESGLIPG
jgi:hypothetical protein